MKKILKIFFILIFILIIGTAFYKVQAATANIKANKLVANVGDTVEITVSVNAASWNLNVTGSVSDSIVGYDPNGNNTLTTQKYTIKLEREGTYTVNLKGDVTDTTDDFDNIDQHVTITANAQATPQTPTTPTTPPATLTSLTIGGKTYSNPSKDITVNVDNETDNIAVKAVTSNGEACSISSTSGSKSSPVKLSEGTTNIYITLASGAKYTIRVQRAAKKVETQPNVMEQNNEEKPEEKVKLLLDSLKVNGFDIQPEFSPEIYSYKIDINMDENDVKDLDIEAKANTEDAKIEISGEKDLKEGENLVTITVTSADDAENVVYQIVVNKIVTSSEVVSLENTIQDSILQEENNTPSKTQIIIVAVAIVTAILGIIFAIVEYNYTKNDEEDFGKGNIFDYDKELKPDDENNESNGYVEELYKSKNIENEFEDFNDEKRKKKSKGKH